jgi:hypothetical protein
MRCLDFGKHGEKLGLLPAGVAHFNCARLPSNFGGDFDNLVSHREILRQSPYIANATTDLRPQIDASPTQPRQSAQSYRWVR